jgi:hypothetical protein
MPQYNSTWNNNSQSVIDLYCLKTIMQKYISSFFHVAVLWYMKMTLNMAYISSRPLNKLTQTSGPWICGANVASFKKNCKPASLSYQWEGIRTWIQSRLLQQYLRIMFHEILPHGSNVIRLVYTSTDGQTSTEGSSVKRGGSSIGRNLVLHFYIRNQPLYWCKGILA